MRALFIALVLLLVVPIARADAIADRTVRLVVPTARNSALDVIARLLQPDLARQFGHEVTVDNRLGDDGFTAVEFAAKSQSDEQVVLIGAVHNLVVNPIHKRIQFNVLKEFTPIALLGKLPSALLVRRTLAVNDLAGFVAYAKANPHRLRYGVSEGFNPSNLVMLAIVNGNALDMECLEYRDSPEATDALIRGRIDAMFGVGASLARAIKSGKVKELKTKPEATLWVGVLVPRNTSNVGADLVHQAVLAALHKDTVENKLRSMSLQLETDPSPAAFKSFLEAQQQYWANVIRESGIKD